MTRDEMRAAMEERAKTLERDAAIWRQHASAAYVADRFAAEADALRALLAREQAQQEALDARPVGDWQPIETAPTDGRWILVLFPKLGAWPVFWSTAVFDDGFWCVSDNKSEDRPLRGWSGEPTMWHAFPAPPAQPVGTLGTKGGQ